MRFVLPFATPSLNEYLRWHWARRGKFRDECILLLRIQLRKMAPYFSLTPGMRMHVEVVRFSAGALDRDNLIGGCKPLVDALRAVRVIHDDNAAHIEAEYEQRRCAQGQGYTEIYVCPILNTLEVKTKVASLQHIHGEEEHASDKEDDEESS